MTELSCWHSHLIVVITITTFRSLSILTLEDNLQRSLHYLDHPAHPITIYDISDLVGTAFPIAFTRQNSCKGFQAAGFILYKLNIFTDKAFLALHSNISSGSGNIFDNPKNDVTVPVLLVKGTSLLLQISSTSKEHLVTPGKIGPFPKPSIYNSVIPS